MNQVNQVISAWRLAWSSSLGQVCTNRQHYTSAAAQPWTLSILLRAFVLPPWSATWTAHVAKLIHRKSCTVNQWPFQEPKLELPTTYKYTLCMYIIYVYKACVRYVREYLDKIWPYIVQYLHFRVLKFPLSVGGPCSIAKWGSGAGAIAQIRPWKQLMQSTYKSISK